MRDEESSLVLEGTKSVLEIVASNPGSVRFVVTTPEWADEHREPLRGTTVLIGSQAAIDRLSDTASPQPVLAVVAQPRWRAEDILTKPGHLLVYGEELQDPTNVGTMIRSAAAFGVDAVWLSPGSADPFSPKVVRATAGMVLKIPVFTETLFDRLIPHRSVLFAADSDRNGGRSLTTITRRPPRLTLAFGNEGRGLSVALRRSASVRFVIPIRPAVESLNVATAAGIALYHFSVLPTSETGPA